MSRIGPCQDAKRWYGAVIDFLNERLNKLNGCRKTEWEKAQTLKRIEWEKAQALERPEERVEFRPDQFRPDQISWPGLANPKPNRKPFARFLRDIDTHIRNAEYVSGKAENDKIYKVDADRKDDEYYKEKEALRVKSATLIVVYFYCASKAHKEINPQVADFLERARLRYCDDPKRRKDRALNLWRAQKGNPGTFSQTRTMTPDADEEAMLLVKGMTDTKEKELVAVRTAAKFMRISEAKESTIRVAARRSARRNPTTLNSETPSDYDPFDATIMTWKEWLVD